MSSSIPPRCIEAMDESYAIFESGDPSKRTSAALSFIISLGSAVTFYDPTGDIREHPLTRECYEACLAHLKENMTIDRWDAFTNFHGYDKVLDN